MTKPPWLHQHWKALSVSCALGIAGLIFDLAAPSGVTAGMAYVLFVLSAAWLPWIYTAFTFAGVATTFAISGYFLVPVTETSLRIVQLNHSLAVLSLWVVAVIVYFQKRTEHKLQDYSAHLQAVLDTVIDGIITINDRGIIQSFNPSAERIFGYKANEVIGQNINILMPEPYHSQHDGYMHHYLTTGEAKVIGIGREVKARRKDGSVFPMELGINEMRVNNERMFAGTIRDITERKEAERKIEKAIEELSESNTELERFAYIASHDLQEPLRMVTSFTELLAQKYGNELDEDARHYIEYASNSATYMRQLIDNLLEYARIGGEAERYEEINTNELLNYVKTNLQESIRESGATITADSLPIIRGNPIRITRLLQNLIGNGIKYQRKGVKPRLSISADDKGDSWLFAVKDNGIGMKPEYCQQIFLPFKRLHGKHEYAGTGIGLSICKKIVESMGGTIWAESTPGKGSVFLITLPKLSNQTSEEM